MSDMDTKRQMQEALDAELQPDAFRELMGKMAEDTATSREYERLRSVDEMLSEARTSRRPVPNRLAEKILARVADPESLPAPQPLKSGAALAAGLCVASVVAFVVLLGLAVWALSVFGTGTALGGLALGIVGGAVTLYAGVDGLLNFAGALIARYPMVFAALLLIPGAAYGLSRLEVPTDDDRAEGKV